MTATEIHQGPAGVIPDGTYDAELVAVKRFKNMCKKWVHFDFVLQGGRVDGLKITKTATLSYSRESRLAATMQGLLGRSEEFRGISERQSTAREENIETKRIF